MESTSAFFWHWELGNRRNFVVVSEVVHVHVLEFGKQVESVCIYKGKKAQLKRECSYGRR